MRTPVSSKARSTLTWSILMLWQRGIRSEVRLAAAIPATRATANASPFFRRPSRTSRRVSGCMRIMPAGARGAPHPFLGGDVHHAGLPLLIEMTQVHGQPPICRIERLVQAPPRRGFARIASRRLSVEPGRVKPHLLVRVEARLQRAVGEEPDAVASRARRRPVERVGVVGIVLSLLPGEIEMVDELQARADGRAVVSHRLDLFCRGVPEGDHVDLQRAALGRAAARMPARASSIEPPLVISA